MTWYFPALQGLTNSDPQLANITGSGLRLSKHSLEGLLLPPKENFRDTISTNTLVFIGFMRKLNQISLFPAVFYSRYFCVLLMMTFAVILVNLRGPYGPSIGMSLCSDSNVCLFCSSLQFCFYFHCLFLFVLFSGHTQPYSGLIPDSKLRDLSWWYLWDYMWYQRSNSLGRLDVRKMAYLPTQPLMHKCSISLCSIAGSRANITLTYETHKPKYTKSSSIIFTINSIPGTEKIV